MGEIVMEDVITELLQKDDEFNRRLQYFENYIGFQNSFGNLKEFLENSGSDRYENLSETSMNDNYFNPKRIGYLQVCQKLYPGSICREEFQILGFYDIMDWTKVKVVNVIDYEGVGYKIEIINGKVKFTGINNPTTWPFINQNPFYLEHVYRSFRAIGRLYNLPRLLS